MDAGRRRYRKNLRARDVHPEPEPIRASVKSGPEKLAAINYVRPAVLLDGLYTVILQVENDRGGIRTDAELELRRALAAMDRRFHIRAVSLRPTEAH